jgi:hypothetical protein
VGCVVSGLVEFTLGLRWVSDFYIGYSVYGVKFVSEGLFDVDVTMFTEGYMKFTLFVRYFCAVRLLFICYMP